MTDHPIRNAAALVVMQAAESRMLLAGMATSIFFVMALLSFGVIEQGRQFDQTQARQVELLEANQRIIEFLEDFAVAESRADDDGRKALAENLRCVVRIFLPSQPYGPPGDEAVNACFRPTPPAPDPENLEDLHQTTPTRGGN